MFKVAAMVVAVFVACWWPFLKAADTALPLQVVQRLFPFGRGLYEVNISELFLMISQLNAYNWPLCTLVSWMLFLLVIIDATFNQFKSLYKRVLSLTYNYRSVKCRRVLVI